MDRPAPAILVFLFPALWACIVPVHASDLTAYDIGAPDTAVWLCELPQNLVGTQQRDPGDHNGHAGQPNGEIRFRGKRSRNGVSLAAVPASVTYHLRGKYRTFHAVAAIHDQSTAEQPIVFRVECDGVPVWESWCMEHPGDSQACLIDITGVDRLTLVSSNIPYYARFKRWLPEASPRPIWLEPYVDEGLPSVDLGVPIVVAAEFRPAVEINLLTVNCRKLLSASEFAEMEKIWRQTLSRVRQTGPREGDFCALNGVYRALSSLHEPTEDAWTSHLERLESWCKNRPESYMANTALAVGLTEYAKAHELTEDGVPNVSSLSKLSRARRILRQQLRPGTPPDTLASEYMLIVGAQMRDRVQNDYKVALTDALKCGQRRRRLVMLFAEYLSEIRQIDTAEIAEFGRSYQASNDRVLADIVYAGGAYGLVRRGGWQAIERSDVDVEKLKSACKRLMNSAPTGTGDLCLLAFISSGQNDHETGRELFQRFGATDPMISKLWHSHNGYDLARRQAFDLPPAACTQTAEHFGTRLAALGYSASGKTLVGAGAAGNIFCWKVNDGSLAKGLLACSRIYGAEVHPTEPVILVAGTRTYMKRPDYLEAIRLTDLDQSRVLMKSRFEMATYSPDGNTVAVWGPGKSIAIVDVNNGKTNRHVSAEAEVHHAKFRPDGKQIAVAGRNGSIWIYDAVTLEQVDCLVDKSDQQMMSRKISWVGNGALFACIDDGGYRFHPLDGRDSKSVGASGGRITDHDVAPNGKYAVVARASGMTELITLPELECVCCFRAHTNTTQQVVFSPAGTTLATASVAGDLRIWDISRLLNTERPATEASK
jgi:hypothetical protein